MKIKVIGVPLNALGARHCFDIDVDIPENPTDNDIIKAVYSKAEHVYNIGQIIEQVRKENVQ